MFFAYFDETGDPGYPKYTTQLFCHVGLYFHDKKWRDNFNKLKSFRQAMLRQHHLPLKTEIHTSELLLNKNPYHKLNLSDSARVDIVTEFCKAMAQLDAKAVKVVIDKANIRKGTKYNVIDSSFSYAVQRICNRLDSLRNITRDREFLVITDAGHTFEMRKTARRIQVYNPIFNRRLGRSLNHPIITMLGDPLEQESRHSYFVQASDCLSFIVNLYLLRKVTSIKPHNRLPPIVTHQKVISWLDILAPIHNVSDSTSNEHQYGIVYYPKPSVQ